MHKTQVAGQCKLQKNTGSNLREELKMMFQCFNSIRRSKIMSIYNPQSIVQTID